MPYMMRSHCSAKLKQPCLNKAKNDKDQRATLTVKTIYTSIFRHVNNYIVEKHGKRKMLL